MKALMNSQFIPSWRGQWLGWICLATLVFFNALPNAYPQMVNFPHILIWQAGFLCLGIWGIWMLRQFKVPFHPLGFGIDWGVGLIVLALILSVIFAEFQEVAAYNLSMALGYGILLYTLRNWLQHSRLTGQRLWQGICFLGCFLGIASLILWLFSCFEGEGFQFVRNAYPIGNPNFTASYFLLILPLVFTYSLSCQGWQRWLGFLGSAELLLVFYTTGSRGGLLGFLVLLIAGSLLTLLQVKKHQKKKCAIALSAIILLALGLIITNHRIQDSIEVASSAQQPEILQLEWDNSIQKRFSMWHTGFNLIQDQPLLGVGIGNMSRTSNPYRPVAAKSTISLVHSLHSTPLQILGEMGLVGFSAVLIFLGLIIRLWLCLYQRLSLPKSRYLLYGIGGSLVAYSASVLTDYQLENIGISGTIVCLLVLLLTLADDSSVETSPEIKTSIRRVISLVSIGFLTLACFASLPLTIAMGINERGEYYLKQENWSPAFNAINSASEVVPWEPVYPIFLGQRALELRKQANNQQEFENLSDLAIQYLQRGVAAAPNDQWFHYTLGLAWYPINPEQAEQEFKRVIQILPRENFYSYYLLASLYLQTNQSQEKIITALALQGLVQPEFLTFPVWETNQQFAEIKEEVLQQTLTYLEQLQNSLTLNTEDYNQIYEFRVLLKWWHQRPQEEIEMFRLRPVTQALLTAETSPEKALNITQSALEETPEDLSLLLLQAWLKPNEYLKNYLSALEKVQAKKDQNHFSQFDELSQEKAQAIKEHMTNNRDPHQWMQTLLPQAIEPGKKKGLIYTYRNFDVTWIGLIPPPPELEYHSIVRTLKLFPAYPNKLLPLEYLVNEVRTTQLSNSA